MKEAFKKIEITLTPNKVAPKVDPASKTPELDAIINFFTDPTSATLGLMIGKLPWDIISPYIGAYLALMTYDQMQQNKAQFEVARID